MQLPKQWEPQLSLDISNRMMYNEINCLGGIHYVFRDTHYKKANFRCLGVC